MASSQGPVEKAARADIEELGDLVGVEPTLAATAVELAKAIDSGEDFRQLAGLAKELRSTLKSLVDGRVEDDDDEFRDMASAE